MTREQLDKGDKPQKLSKEEFDKWRRDTIKRANKVPVSTSGMLSKELGGVKPDIKEEGVGAMRLLVINGYRTIEILDVQPDYVKPGVEVIKSKDDGKYYLFEEKSGK